MASDLLVLRFLLAALLDRRPPVAPSFVARFYLPLYFTGDLRWPCLIFYVFTGRVLFVTTSGGPIFRCTTKDRGERRAKGLRPLESPELMFWRKPDVLCATLLATVRVTRLSRAWRAQAHCFHALCVLRCLERLKDLRNHPTSDYKLGWLFSKCQRFLCIWCSTIESVETVRSTPRTGLNRVNCTRANT